MTQGKWDSLAANSASVLGARLVVPLLNVALVVSVARVLGVAELGRYTLLITLFLLWENLKSLGLPTLMIREIARDGEHGLVHYRSLVRIGLGGALIGIGTLVGVALEKSGTIAVLLPAFVISLGLLPSAYVLANDALFLALGQARHSIKISSLENTVRLVGSLIAVLVLHGGVLSLCAVYALTRGLAAVAGALIIRRNFDITLPRHDRSVTWGMLERAPAFVAVFVFPIILFRMDVVLLGILASNYAVGVYSAAMRLVTLCLIVPDSIMSAIFAVLSKLSGNDTLPSFRDMVQRTIRWMTVLLLPAAMIGSFAASEIIQFFYGSSFAPAVPVFQLLVWGLLPFAVNRALGDALVAQGHQSTVATIILTTVAISVAIYFFLVPRYAFTGAAWGFVLSVLVMCLLTVVWCVWRTHLADPFTVAMSLTPGVLALVAAAVRPNQSTISGALVRTIVFLAGVCVVITMGVPELHKWRATKLSSASQRAHIGATS